MTRRLGRQGFTLLELVIALAIVGALLVVAFGGLRVAIAAWTQGDDRSEAHQHLRGVAAVLARGMGATFPYRGTLGQAPDAVVLFRGTERRVEFVTQSPPFPPPVPVAFTAVVIALESEEGPALVIRQRVLPNREPFTDAQVVLRDAAIQRLELRYLNESGVWQEEWNAEEEQALPRAVQIVVASTRAGRVEALPPLTVALRTVLQ
jgi:prepilin-type N-terminal cleavage/methylation domain-containing protein